MKITVLDNATLANTSLACLEQLGSLKTYELTSPEQVVEHSQGADILITNKVVLNRETISQLKNLKLICVSATGTNNVDLEAAKDHGIAVTNVAGYSTPSVVQHTFSLITNLLGNTHRYQADCQQGAWQKSEMFCRLDYSFNDLQGKTLTIIGGGTLGQAVANVAEAFGANVVMSERKGAPCRDGRTPFDEAIKTADIISVHCPLTEETRNLITLNEFKVMKPSCIIINTARGGIINEADLTSALEQNIIAGAGVDVLTKEPAELSNPLANYKGSNLLLTPHIAWASTESIVRLVKEVSLNIKAFKQGEPRSRLV
ncbi:MULTISPECIES: D-2-hydroxyacid dehydrogenase [Pseudoalteromonas]|jgi:glycerate dehydrogenase|uniref:D-2-hydroxyacid dehydrogenase n=1 Tax=Pseudoalteromonas TaxID=53246 RepID=UPI000231993C|nr:MULTISPECIES: D-2-hydroxyacid dehydrogenase [Pseudoalteromonas]MBL1383851.1 D-2-hydroxyacid dehydrogenase [Colwellia sp.]ATG57158.1 glycerate dehydrogenase [Pseudoalteromonas marina]TMS82946.1 glycerate dehydrogenase [Pseudoalteromonas sp. S554]BBW92675.1 lactate dehydrogenase [Pseudoalteromonas sp. PS1M3]GAA74510.1 2-hydroxyacid dehydrogenase family protein [Pseudoalteromonas sp. BSi20480]|tara:strand:+ start:9322 stop:10266 length:945 start_codon:yes stop_codon:yes gene_type:complete